MNKYYESHPFWGSHAPLSTLANAGLIILGSSRMAYALLVFLAVMLIYTLSSLIILGAKKILPGIGIWMAALCASGFIAALFILVISLVTPVLYIEMSFMILLIPISFIYTGVYAKRVSLNLEDGLYESITESLSLGFLIVGVALIREPLAFGSLSFPGGLGVFEFLYFTKEDGFLLKIMSTSSGALILLGYGCALFYNFRSRTHGGEE